MKKKIILGVAVLLTICISGAAYYFYNRNSVKILQAEKHLVIEDLSKSENNKAAEIRVVNNKPIVDKPLDEKEVFLTFDDGPSNNTMKILKILDDNNIKASFFVMGQNVDKYPDMVKAVYNDGMSILNHSYSHQYSMYKSVDRTTADFRKCDDAIKKALGVEPSKFIRFPGGSDNRVSGAQNMKEIRNTIVSSGKAYVDWNVSSGDAASKTVPADTIKSNLIGQLSKKNFAVVLMHDTNAKNTTVEALPSVIKYLKENGFVFRTFDDITPTEEKRMIEDKIINRNVNK